MATNSQARVTRESYEYIVYTFQRCNKKHQDKWQLQESFENEREAMFVAKNLFDSGQFCRVEVKEKYTDSLHGHISDTTLKIFERKSGMSFQKFLTLIGVEA